MNDSINLEENFPYSGYTEKQLKDIVGEISNRIAKETSEVNLLRAIHYSSVTVNELNTRKFNEQIDVLKEQLKNAKDDSKSSTYYAIAAIVISIVLGIFSMWSTFIKEKHTLPYKQILQMEQEQINVQHALLKSINQKHISHNEYHLSNKPVSRKKP